MSKAFVREATGLVRTFSPFDAFVFNQMNVVMGAIMWFLPASAVFTYPDGNLLVSLPLGWLLLTATAGYVFYALGSSMPRSGGSYVWISRAIHPAVGFVLNWIHVFAWIIWVGIWGGLLGTFAFPIFLTTVGVALNNPGMIDLAGVVSSPLISFLIGTIFIIVLGVSPAIGLRRFTKFQLIEYILSMLGLTVAIVLIAASSHAEFLAALNRMGTHFGSSPGWAESLVDTAKSKGMTLPEFTATGTFKQMLAPVIGSTIWPLFGLIFVSGEVKQVRNSMLIGVFGSGVLYIVYFMAMLLAVFKTVGYDLFAAMNYLLTIYSVGPSGYSPSWAAPPYYSTFAGLLTDNFFLQILILVAMSIFSFGYIPQAMLTISRSVMAWSFDRVGPEKLSQVNPRLSTPVIAVVASMVVSEIFLVAYVLFPVFFAFILPYTLEAMAFAGIGIAGVVFPYRMKSQFNSSPVKHKIGGVPLVTVCGLGMAILFILRLGLLFLDPIWAPAFTPLAQVSIVGSILTGAIWFYAFRAYRKSKGLDTDLAYRQLPPE